MKKNLTRQFRIFDAIQGKIEECNKVYILHTPLNNGDFDIKMA